MVRIREAAARYGRDPDQMTPSLFATVNLNPDQGRAREELDDYSQRHSRLPLARTEKFQPFFGGPADKCVEWLGDYVRAGARHFVPRLGSFDEPLRHPRALSETVLPGLREMTV